MDRYKRYGNKWEWNREKKDWDERKLNTEEIKSITDSQNRLFDAYMNKIYMIINLNRNVGKNHLIRMLSGLEEEQIQHEQEEQTITGLEALKRKIGDIRGKKDEDTAT